MTTKSERDKIYWAQTHSAKRRISRYGVTPEIFDELFQRQGYMCGICETTDPGKRGWHLDHSHSSKSVRGILCMNCNLLLGHAKDSEALLTDAILYLRLSNNKNTKVAI